MVVKMHIVNTLQGQGTNISPLKVAGVFMDFPSPQVGYVIVAYRRVVFFYRACPLTTACFDGCIGPKHCHRYL